MNDKGTSGPICAETEPRRGFVYFIGSGDTIKIGFSRYPNGRLRGLQTSHSNDLKVLGVLQSPPASEKELHHRFRHLHIRGEWFRAEADLLELVQGFVVAPPARMEKYFLPPVLRAPKEPPIDPVWKALRTSLCRRYHTLSEDARPIASNLIEQIGNYSRGTAEQRALLKPHMARSIELLEQRS